AEVAGLKRAESAGQAGWSLSLRLTIRGKSVERSLPVTWSEKEGGLTAEVLGEFHFRDFGIEPYSTMLGAIRNDDRFHLFVRVVARAAASPAPAAPAP
ncbi:MAG: YceI family protein, partial [Thermoanaerobaculia bacterium]